MNTLIIHKSITFHCSILTHKKKDSLDMNTAIEEEANNVN